MAKCKIKQCCYSEDKMTYLQMIQSTMERMSTVSAIFKGFAATVFTGMTAISFTEVRTLILSLSLVPVFCFALMDIYYLCLEKRYRHLYEQVRSGKQEVSFSLTPPTLKELKEYCILWKCIKSFSILPFYGLLLTLGIVIMFLNFFGVI